METVIKTITDNNEENNVIYEQAAAILKQGGLVAFPTETVYGLGANALDEEASAKIYAAKGRPSDNPLIVHIADVNDLYKLSSDVSASALSLAEKFWPGPLTMILKKSDIVPGSITGGLGTVAIRMPGHKTALELIRKSGVYIAAPSANISGKPSPTRAAHVIHDMNGRIDMIISDDTVDIGVESTIIDITEEVPVILRPGFITKHQLEEVLGAVEIDPAIMGTLDRHAVPKAPGMKYKHYAPDADMVIVEGKQNDVVSLINRLAREKKAAGSKVGVMASTETAKLYEADVVKATGSRDDEAAAARRLYALLREFDEAGVDYIYTESFPAKDVGQAVMNRLIKAAGHTIINADSEA